MKPRANQVPCPVCGALLHIDVHIGSEPVRLVGGPYRLTVTVDDASIERAKDHIRSHGTGPNGNGGLPKPVAA